MILPLILIVCATALAAAMAYGTDPLWAQYPHGLHMILLARQFQLPLIAGALIFCAALMVLVISGKRRVWWLIGLGPVLALFAHHFATDPQSAFSVLDEPDFIAANEATFLAPDDYVVGLVFNGDAFAYPLGTLYRNPVVVHADHDRRLILLWSAFANRAFAAEVDRAVKGRELEVVSMPANMLLVYNTRLGEFINGITGATFNGTTPSGFDDPIPTVKTPWKIWAARHPDTYVLGVAPAAGAPHGPVLPYYPMPKHSTALPPATRVAMIATTQPVAAPEADIGLAPVNTDAGPTPLLLLRDRDSGVLRAFARELPGDLMPSFRPRLSSKYPAAALQDQDSNSLWTSDGKAIAGPLNGQTLRRIVVDDDVYWDVAGPWFPQTQLLTQDQLKPAVAADDEGQNATDQTALHRRKRRK